MSKVLIPSQYFAEVKFRMRSDLPEEFVVEVVCGFSGHLLIALSTIAMMNALASTPIGGLRSILLPTMMNGMSFLLEDLDALYGLGLETFNDDPR